MPTPLVHLIAWLASYMDTRRRYAQHVPQHALRTTQAQGRGLDEVAFLLFCAVVFLVVVGLFAALALQRGNL